MTQPVLDPCRCPLCGMPNACAMACGDQVATGPCWCTRVQFSADLLAQVPEAARNRSCICQRCATPEPALKD
ncbi:cysteine-rich CWC family protein [Limnohabitans sp. Bal53]|uniref:cysteine-rich CWC family protein n=1 Tax=Limnohabitans sp. Bal53 TaxID=1977910 RepID=UPI000D389C9E|nr:cysteine-rich CWC family protein [Limnohabitans sp. Bal53]PUE40592.1 hypothetical protein B9Z50_09940 [Limnohabitans sp. Bal53]